MSLSLTIKYCPHSGQRDFHESKARFRILACGRRWGKTICGANEFIVLITSAPPNAIGFCVAPTYWHTQKQWREFNRYIPEELVVDRNIAERRITLIDNRIVWFKSADNPDSLRSEGIDALWVDEGAQIKEEAWTLALRPALMDKHGRAIFTGTPKGKNWYFQLWTRGQDPKQGDYKSWNYPSGNNPYLDKSEIQEFARDMPTLAYKQEILGLFIEDVGSVFRKVESCIEGSLAAPVPNEHYVMGADLAKHEDFTVVCVLDAQGHLCAFDRFGELDWVFQRKRLVNKCREYNARDLIDSTGIGDPILDELRRHNIRVEGYKFTSASKADLIENLSMMIEQHKITYPGKPAAYDKDGKKIGEAQPDIPELVNELKLYGYTTTKGGTTQYGAPEGYHDDCVIALALAAWMLRSGPLEVGRGHMPW